MENSALVSTAFVADHLGDPAVRLVESNEDQLLYRAGHIPGAVEIDWVRELNHPVRRDYLDREGFEALLRRLGIDEKTTVVFYGDRNNWWAAYSFWVFQLFGFKNAKLMDGGKLKWEKEKRPLTKDVPSYSPSRYTAPQRDDSIVRAFRDEVLEHVKNRGQLVDVRSPDEFSGAKLHMEGYPNEGALRGGHIPGALSIPWAKAVNPEDGTFLPPAQLKELYQASHHLDPSKPVVVYCRIGERSAHTWFVLTQLLGFKTVKNYDGSWTEWGNLVGVPIENPSKGKAV